MRAGLVISRKSSKPQIPDTSNEHCVSGKPTVKPRYLVAKMLKKKPTFQTVPDTMPAERATRRRVDDEPTTLVAACRRINDQHAAWGRFVPAEPPILRCSCGIGHRNATHKSTYPTAMTMVVAATPMAKLR